MFEFKITEENNKYFNIKELLKSYYNMSDKLIAKLKRYKRIFKNGVPAYVTATLDINDIVTIDLNFDEEVDNIESINHKLDIIYEDDYMLIINKEAGYPIHPSNMHHDDTISNFVKYYFETNNIKRKIRPVNRLDKDTSGITIFAKSDYIQDMLIKQMKENIFKKEYLAITEGIFTEKEGLISAPIARKYGSIIEREINFNEDPSLGIDYKLYPAETLYKVITENQKDNLSLVNYTLLTGRTHQIRLHSKYKGAPLLGDYLYNKESDLISRQALHSYKITFIHPITKKPLEFTAKLPDDMENIITKFNLK